MALVRGCLVNIASGRRDRRTKHRLERLRQAPEFMAMVLAIGGKSRHPDVYVKWVLSPAGTVPAVWFLSFHSSVRLAP